MEIDLVNWSIIKVAIPVGSTSRDLIFMLYSSHIVYAKEVQIVYTGCLIWKCVILNGSDEPEPSWLEP